MPRPLQLSANFRPWRIGSLMCGTGLIVFGFRLMAAGAAMGNVGAAIIAIACFIAAAVFIVPPSMDTLARPITSWLDDMFYPTETLRLPPEALLRALRMRLRDRHWDSVDQQTRELLGAYGPSADLYHLRALMEGGRSGNCSAVTVEASKKLPNDAFDRYTALLRRDPPPREIQTGIEA